MLPSSDSPWSICGLACGQLQACLLAREELERRVEKLEQTLERTSGVMDELTLQLRAARDGMSAAMLSRDTMVKDLDCAREELAATYERLQAVTNELREAKVR
jgi:hypothetical protein